MFRYCEIKDIKSLENWNVSNGVNFEGIFFNCLSLNDIKPLENWNVSNGTNFSNIFFYLFYSYLIFYKLSFNKIFSFLNY